MAIRGPGLADRIHLGAGASLITESNDHCLNQSDGASDGFELMNIGIVDSEANGTVLGQRAGGHRRDRDHYCVGRKVTAG